MHASDLNLDFLQLKLGLHRKLFSFIRVSRTEEEILRFILNSLWEYFPESRVCFSHLGHDGQMKVLFSRQSSERQEVVNKSFDLTSAPEYLRQLLGMKMAVVNDFRSESGCPPEFTKKVLAATGSVSRLDCPIGEAEGGIRVLSLTYPVAREWSEAETDLLAEMAELIQVFSREARAQNALKDNEAIFRQFAENIDAVFWMADPENNESIYVSPSYDRIWGIPRESLKTDAKGFLNSILPEDLEKVITSMKGHRLGPQEKLYRIRRPNGEIRWIRDRSFPIRNEVGMVYRVVGIAEDITPLKDAQEQLEATQAQVISNAKFAALGEMASGIAHEINNPLAVILGISGQLQERLGQNGEIEPFVQNGFNTIDKMSRRIATIIKGLRTFSRQTDRDPMASSDFLQIIHETLALCDSGIQTVSARLDVKLPSESQLIRCRPSEISQVLLNLMNNAKDAVSCSKEKSISLELKRVGSWIYFTVEDSGPGVPQEIRERIFQPFFTTKEVGAGTGLGLSISKGIVETHGGQLYLDSSEKGAKFVVRLPAEAK